MIELTPTRLDRAIASIFPGWGAGRFSARVRLQAMETVASHANYRFGTQGRTERGWERETPQRGPTLSRLHSIGNMAHRARTVDRDNPIGRGILDRLTDNVVGRGFRLQARTTNKAFNAEVEEKWQAWLDSAELTGLLRAGRLQRNIYRALERDGDVGLWLRRTDDPTRIEIVEKDRIASPLGKGVADNIYDGVEFNASARVVAYHVLVSGRNGERDYVRVDAKDFLFYPRLDRGNEVRGTSCFATVFGHLDHLDNMVEAEVVAAWMGTVFGLIFKGPNQPNAFSGLTNTVSDSRGDTRAALTLEAGQLKYLGGDDEVVQVVPQTPRSNTPPFVQMMLRIIGQAVSMPLEIVTLDFSAANLSVARAAIKQFYRSCRAKQDDFKAYLLDPLYSWWLDRMIVRGGFTAAVPADFAAHEFQADGWEALDEIVEAQAALLRIRSLLSTHAEELGRLGKDYQDVLFTAAQENEQRQELGLVMPQSTFTRDTPAPAPGDGEEDKPEDAENPGAEETPGDGP